MILILIIDVVVVFSLVRANRRRLEDVLPTLCFWLVLLPIESKLVIPGLFDLSTSRVALVTVFCLFLSRRDQWNRDPIPLKHLMWLHILWAVCSTLYSLSVATSVKQLVSQVVEYYFLYYVILRTISDIRTVHKIVYAMMVAMSVCCIFATLEAYGSYSILRIFPSDLWITYNGGLDPLYTEFGRGLRVRSTFAHPILFGVALAMSIPLGLYLLSVWEGQRQRLMLWMTVVLMFWALYKTSSRGPWLAAIGSLVLLLFLVANRVRKYVMTMVILAVLVLVARPGIWQTIVDLYISSQDTATPVGASYEFRYALMNAIVNAVGKEPVRTVFGYGLGTFRELGLNISHMNVVQHWYTCDNNWGLFLYETGYGGLIIISALLLKALLMTLQSYWRLPRPEKYFSGVLFVSLAGFYFSLLSVAGYSWGQQGYMAWMLISLSVAYPTIVLRDAYATPANGDGERCLVESEYAVRFG
jgi:O-Antigen ligase